jgi:cysteine peptidase B
MKKAVVVLLTLCVVAASASKSYEALFQGFKHKFGKSYATAEEESRRFDNFAQNMLVAEAMRASNPLATFGINAFSDLSAEEFRVYHNGRAYFAAKDKTVSAEQPALPRAGKSIDWRTKGAVTPVKNQGQCGSCWAFSSTGNIEGQWKLAGNELVSLSEQELVSCDTTSDGCNGGLMDLAFEWLIKARGGAIDTEASYPYKSGSGVAPKCDLNGKKVGAKIKGYKNIAKSESAMADFVYSSGPLSVAVDATSWQTYTSGIMTNCISQQIDHGVLIVGFDTAYSTPYWIIKNSWAASWGEEGYIRVKYGSNECLITSDPCTSIAA